MGHCLENVPYCRYLTISGPILQSFSITDQNVIGEHQTFFCYYSYPSEPIYRTSTSVPTGTPFTVVKDLGERGRHIAHAGHLWIQGVQRGKRGLLHRDMETPEPRNKHIMRNIVPIEIVMGQVLRSC